MGRVCSDFFKLFGVGLIMGRHFEADEQFIGHADVVIISEKFWRTRLNGRDDILGSTIHLNGMPVTIVGVVSAEFSYPPYPGAGTALNECEIWRPFLLDGQPIDAQFSNLNDQLIARLKPMSSASDLESELDLIAAQLSSSYPQYYRDTNFLLQNDLNSEVTRPFEFAVWAFVCAVVVFLIIASLNVSTLLVTQTVSRHSEMLTRLALGATRVSLISQLLLEFLIVVGVGSMLGLVMASALLRGLQWFTPENMLLLHSVSIDGRSAILAIGITIVLCNAFAIVPCVRALRNASKSRLSAGGRAAGSAGNRTVTGAMTVISTAQVALSVVALMGAALMVTSFVRLVNDEPGYSLDKVLTLRLTALRIGFSAEQRLQVFEEMVRVVQESPFVRSAGLTHRLPLDGLSFNSTTNKRGGSEIDKLSAEWRWVRGRYFDAMGIPTVSGRVFRSTDYGSGARLAVISEGLAQALFPLENPIGRAVAGPFKDTYYTIIGIVGGVRNKSIGEPPGLQVYAVEDALFFSAMSMAIRTAGESDGLIRSLRKSIEEVSGRVAVSDVRTMRDILHNSVANERFSIFIGIMIALACVILALFGVAGLVAYRIEQQSHSIGIRLALGATQMNIVMSYVRQTLIILSAGLVVGLGFSSLLIGVVSPVLHKTELWDPLVMGIVSVLVVSTGLAVSLMVSTRKSTFDPQQLMSL